MQKAYLNDKNEVVECPLFVWALWMEDERNNARRVVQKTVLPVGEVSTVFLGMNHRFGEGTPLWFETATFFTDGDTTINDRYASYAEAKAGHEMVCRELLENSTGEEHGKKEKEE